MAAIQPDKPWLLKLAHDSTTTTSPYLLAKAVWGMSVVATDTGPQVAGTFAPRARLTSSCSTTIVVSRIADSSTAVAQTASRPYRRASGPGHATPQRRMQHQVVR